MGVRGVSFAAALVLLTLLCAAPGASAAASAEEGVHVNPGSPAAHEYALASPFPEPGDVTKGLWVEDGYWSSEPGRAGGTEAS